MYVSYATAARLHESDMQDLYAYRYAVFVERLGWQLPGAQNGLEIDQFDRPDTIHIIARNSDGEVCGCARLLPTERPYLLGEVFPRLMNGAAPPNSHDVWELSRFSSSDLNRNLAAPIWVCREIMAATVACAIDVGAKRLIAVTSRGVEKILQRLKVNWRPVGPSLEIGGHTIFAFFLEIDEETISALELRTEEITAN